MLRNILEKQSQSITINKVFTPQGLSDDPITIKQTVHNHFLNWTHKRNTTSWPNQSWKEQYDPISHISDNIFDNIMNPITESEFHQMLTAIAPYKALQEYNTPF